MGSLFSLCYAGDLSDLKHFVEAEGLTVEDLRSYGNSALILACQSGHLDILVYLLSQGLTVEDLRSDNNKALQSACVSGHLHIVEFLLTHGLTLDDLQGGKCMQPLYLACQKGHLLVVQYLLTYGLTVDHVQYNDDEALRVACYGDYSDIVQALIWAGQYTEIEVRSLITHPEVLAKLVYERPEPALEDLVKPAHVWEPVFACQESDSEE